MDDVKQIESQEKDRRWCVYIHTNIQNDKKYVGITNQLPEKRWGVNGNRYTMEHQPIFARAIQKYGWDGFKHEIVADCLSENEAKQMEMDLIALYQTNCCRYRNPELGYNMTDGGEGSAGRVVSEETRQKISAVLKEYYKNPENHPMYGKHFTDEQRATMSEAHKGIQTGENNPMYGVHLSEGTRKLISQSAKNRYKDPERHPMYGKKQSVETKQKIASLAKERLKNPQNNPMYGKTQSEKTRCAVSKAQSRLVVQLSKSGEFIAEYESGVMAERLTGISSASISSCCVGRNISAGGFLWINKCEYDPLYSYSYEERKELHYKKLKEKGD